MKNPAKTTHRKTVKGSYKKIRVDTGGGAHDYRATAVRVGSYRGHKYVWAQVDAGRGGFPDRASLIWRYKGNGALYECPVYRGTGKGMHYSSAVDVRYANRVQVKFRDGWSSTIHYGPARNI
ncbi:hypothetical protein J4573_41145 [Actinomadura barringtoniae]|uniref:Uncharacterized protein n=1 Tax=Actinomadura barringtoniae TaxID=1427535 RepID=A0A939PP64_9ACTN|nr:hypothetical protein [Actinomadura barringtoniae]MBO2453554.1 hypothetical protein [Actinomadura barringtoniae]